MSLFPNSPIPLPKARQNELEVSGELDAAVPETVLHLGAGRTVAVPTEWLLHGLPASGATRAAAPHQAAPQAAAAAPPIPDPSPDPSPDAAPDPRQVIPLLAEELQVGKRTVTTGTVRLHRSTERFTDSVGIDLTRTGWDIERVPVGQLYTERPEVRQEGDVTIYPLVEERLVAKREYFLLEEVRVRRVATTTERQATLELQRDVLTVEREGETA